ncbi:MAG: glycosyltransferase, partial [Candidatus Riflebacteria bacterium]|nr:glycosyltransferase [Candidatus Riflebacteria bacterium]
MTPNHPLVSVIVCTRARPEMLARALDSVFSQTWPPPHPPPPGEGRGGGNSDRPNLEVLVVDDGTELPASLPPEFESRVRRVRTTGGAGAGADRAA